tara:strand:- start:110 stop:685 length:576 start_codon:yes stop_codon:yes gene_type:complete
LIPIFTHGIPSNPIIIWDVGWVGSPTLEHREALIPVTSFISTYENRIDKKGRVSVPSAYRLALGNEAYQGVIAYPSLTDTTIEVFGRSTLEQLNQRSFDESLAQGNYAYTLLGSSEDGLIEAIMAIASELPFDTEGRIILPSHLADHALITDRATFVGRGSKFQIWNPEEYEMHQAGELDALRARMASSNQ